MLPLDSIYAQKNFNYFLAIHATFKTIMESSAEALTMPSEADDYFSSSLHK
jgi:hypothetical protein